MQSQIHDVSVYLDDSLWKVTGVYGEPVGEYGGFVGEYGDEKECCCCGCDGLTLKLPSAADAPDGILLLLLCCEGVTKPGSETVFYQILNHQILLAAQTRISLI